MWTGFYGCREWLRVRVSYGHGGGETMVLIRWGSRCLLTGLSAE